MADPDHLLQDAIAGSDTAIGFRLARRQDDRGAQETPSPPHPLLHDQVKGMRGMLVRAQAVQCKTIVVCAY